jgi:hypothetical protein
MVRLFGTLRPRVLEAIAVIRTAKTSDIVSRQAATAWGSAATRPRLGRCRFGECPLIGNYILDSLGRSWRRLGRQASLYLALVGVAAAGALPSASGLPSLIHSTVAATGRAPTCKYTPVNGGSKNCWERPGVLGGVLSNPYLDTRQFPTPRPAFVSAFANASAALLQANQGWFGSSGVHVFPTGYDTFTPSWIEDEGKCDRFSSINCGRHPNCERTIAISFARFRASISGANWIEISVPANACIPANHVAAGGGAVKSDGSHMAW